MKATALLAHLRAQGATVAAEGDQLVLDAPAGLLTPALLTDVRAHKPALLALVVAEWWSSDAVRWQQLRAAPYPPRPVADDDEGWARFCADLARDLLARRGAELAAYAAAEAVRAAEDDDEDTDDGGGRRWRQQRVLGLTYAPGATARARGECSRLARASASARRAAWSSGA